MSGRFSSRPRRPPRPAWAAIVAAMVVALSTACATSGQQSIGDFLDDAAVTTRVKRKLAVDAGESTLAVEVDTVSGVVHLQGAVRSAQDRRTAEAVVRAVVGVKDVVNRLVVKSP